MQGCETQFTGFKVLVHSKCLHFALFCAQLDTRRLLLHLSAGGQSFSLLSLNMSWRHACMSRILWHRNSLGNQSQNVLWKLETSSTQTLRMNMRSVLLNSWNFCIIIDCGGSLYFLTRLGKPCHNTQSSICIGTKACLELIFKHLFG